MGAAISAVLLGGWLLATVAAQFTESSLGRGVRRVDLLGLVPNWSFFAPDPSVWDYHFLVRFRWQDGLTTTFEEIPSIVDRPRRAVWHPEKRASKVIIDCAQALLSLPEQQRQHVALSLPYLTLLALAVEHARPSAIALQFVVVRADNAALDPQLIARSAFHPLSGVQPRNGS